MRIVPLYSSRGDAAALLAYPYIYNLGGEWIGLVTADRDVYSVLGHYVGSLREDRRIVRERAPSSRKPRLRPPPPPRKITAPPTMPLAPMMSELPYSMIDVLLEEPERLHTQDRGELRQDLE
jgi:hypothetical protein